MDVTQMKAFGFTEENEEKAISLSNVALAFSPQAMREFAKFVTYAASEMERLGTHYDHLHFQDFSTAWTTEWPDVQLTRIYE